MLVFSLKIKIEKHSKDKNRKAQFYKKLQKK
jgi:hypothetical protein